MNEKSLYKYEVGKAEKFVSRMQLKISIIRVESRTSIHLYEARFFK